MRQHDHAGPRTATTPHPPLLTRRGALRTAGAAGLAAGLAATGRPAAAQNDAAAIEALARAVVAAVNARDPDALDALVADDFIGHVPLPLPGAGKGLAGVKENLALIWAALPDAQLEVAVIVVSGDTVVVRGELTGTFSGEFLGIAPTEKSLRISGVCVARVVESKAVEYWSHFDALAALEQAGLFSLEEVQTGETGDYGDA